MSIGPAVIATPLTQAPVPQSPASLPAGNGGTPSRTEFSSMLNGAPDSASASLAPQAAPGPERPAQGGVTPHNQLGDQVLNGLRKLGKSIEAMSNMGAPSHDPKPSSTAKASFAAKPKSSNAPPEGTAQTRDLGSDLREMHAMWEGGMQHQRQLYKTVFEFELVQESAQSMMKSLKSLLTQGGG